MERYKVDQLKKEKSCMKSMLEKRVTLEKRRLKQLPTVLHSLLGQLKRKKRHNGGAEVGRGEEII